MAWVIEYLPLRCICRNNAPRPITANTAYFPIQIYFARQTLSYGQIADDNCIMDIGQAIYALRKEMGGTLEEVANDAALPSGVLSPVECFHGC